MAPTEPANSVFFASASYEPRSLAVAANLPDSCHFRLGLVYANEEFLTGPAGDATKSNMDQLKSLLTKRCDVVLDATGSWLNSAKQLQALRFLVGEAAKQLADSAKMNVWVDVTTFTRESLIVGCALLREQMTVSVFRVLYTVPLRHGEWLSRGFREVRNIMGFPGVQIPGASTVLIVMSGFEPERTIRIIDEHEPSVVLLGIGNPPTNFTFLERNLKEQELVLARQEVKRFEFHASSVVECARQLTAVVEQHLPQSNIIMAPMSTKLSTIATMLVAERHPAIQLAYCVPGEYNTESYSEGAQSVFIEDL
ncbi:MAG: hypothetical protein Q7U03_05345 [Syntrophales bacterium]|nr:hypothetical protein [Syntrophales bacterium]